MKKLFSIFICLLLCFTFTTYVHAEDEVDSEVVVSVLSGIGEESHRAEADSIHI